MTTSFDYAWLIYIIASLIVLGCWWFLIRKIPLREAQTLSLVSIAVILLFPWMVLEGEGWAPAWLMVGMEVFSQGPAGFGRAGVPLLIALILALVISTGIGIALNIRRDKQIAR